MAAKKSTNVRLPIGLRWWRAAFLLLQRVWPSAAAALAERLCCLPPRHPEPAREREALRAGRPLRIRFRSGFLRAWRFGQGPAVLLVHGWGGRGGQMTPFVEPLVAAGFSVVTFDGPGHGRSSGRLAALPLFEQALHALQARLGPFRAVIGHSMGAGAAALALRSGLRSEVAVFVSPPRGPQDYFAQFGRLFGLHARTHEAVLARLQRRFGVRPDEIDVQQIAAGQSTPLLVLHDAQDREVPLAHAQAIAERWPGAELVVSDGLGHTRILRDGGTVARAVAFVGAHVSARCGNPHCEAPLGRSWGAATDLCAGCALDAELYQRALRAAAA